VPVAAVDERPVIVDSSAFVSDPAVTTEERAIWEKQVLIPHNLEGKMLAFYGPYPPLSNFTTE
ncbi:hypothetical protein A2U01_0109827, partial [Trifolium medium]|nr:hypothetical protein [Trifolium medium]